MNLQRFVLAARLEEVAAAASEQLRVMSRGRFRLRHHDRIARRTRPPACRWWSTTHAGVDDRPVRALSGGEAFLASLSLALGLSEVVMRRSGGRRLDALFVDEGFGTLDEATLDVAIRALEGLRRSPDGRVISTSPSLRRRIPARIEVRQGEAGSVAVVHPACAAGAAGPRREGAAPGDLGGSRRPAARPSAAAARTAGARPEA